MRLSRTLVGMTAFCIWMLAPASDAIAQQPHLSFSDDVKMLDCTPVSSAPCFATSFNILDQNDHPYGLELGNNLVSNLKVTADGAPAQVFYAAGAAAQSSRRRLTLILIDISGSMARKLPMGQTRFQAARSALAQFLYDFRDGVDQVAIVPFESHNVVSTIESAVFAQNREQAEGLVQALPAPQPRNNTGLYSAVSSALDVLGRKKQSEDVDTLLVVMTDGVNDVQKRDDAGLLTGPDGLAQVHRKVAASGVEVTAIGFGNPAEIDQEALAQLSTHQPYMATNAESLNQAFNVARKLLTNRIQVGFMTTWADAASLAGKSIVFRATLQLPNGTQLTSNEARFETPQLVPPVPSGKAGPDMLRALSSMAAPRETGWVGLLRPVLVFLGLGLMLLIAWFWVPRVIWPGQYMGKVTLSKSTMKWAGGTQSRPGTLPASSGQARSAAPQNVRPRNVPPGFESSSGAAGQRTPRDATIVRPMGEVTRLRLEKEQK